MAIPTTGDNFGLRQADWTPYTDATGTTLGTAIPFYGSQTATIDLQSDEVTLEGDDVTLGTSYRNKRVAISLTVAKMSPELRASLTGGTLTSTGTTPNVVKKVAILGTTSPPYGRLRFRLVTENGVSDEVYTVHYIKFITGPTFNPQSGQYSAATLTGTGISRPSTAALYDYELRETAIVLS